MSPSRHAKHVLVTSTLTQLLSSEIIIVYTFFLLKPQWRSERAGSHMKRCFKTSAFAFVRPDFCLMSSDAMQPGVLVPWTGGVFCRAYNRELFLCHHVRACLPAKPCPTVLGLCESRGGRPGLPILINPYGLCGQH